MTTATTTTRDPELKGRSEIKIFAKPHLYGDAINEFLQKLKEIKVENMGDPGNVYFVSVEDAWVEDEEGMRLDEEKVA